MNSTTLIETRPSWCELRAHDRVIRYQTSGTGRTVLVLADPYGSSGVAQLWAVLLLGLVGEGRVFVPETPLDDDDLSGWLAALLEGLGTSNIRVIAGDRFHAPVLGMLRDEPDQIARVVLVAEDGCGVAAAPTAAVVPVLVVDAAEGPADDGPDPAARVRQFFAGGSAAATA